MTTSFDATAYPPGHVSTVGAFSVRTHLEAEVRRKPATRGPATASARPLFYSSGAKAAQVAALHRITVSCDRPRPTTG
ncbi:hypothetical protein [Rathayibacter iranicus]|uniref:Uncharacterized protein n=2 Tax=Rathayibacter iranicus TaxID=59737 RepID=A0AAD1ACG4_9MICO|nr:hypothetical protein [Rathayibacter iranicus]AZZ54892.1 hypothetical protein C7V51_02600 [Rathayibacter iranicus]MWV31471.1 hypothetical protein [Rathayibacter iranicus NCPPB 2253 = VKM Ac-1602]PWJ61004.1 hypothetical protein B0H03_12110 [Rathayibacter iranicus NCPPB 2253 = VKM Ac-1602]